VFAVIDVETTGGQLYEDRITEIAIYKTDGNKIIDSFSTLVNPGRKIMPFVVKLTGITDAMVANAPTFEDISDKIEDFTRDCIFVAHNIAFDYSVVKREFKRIGKGYRRNSLCTVKLAQKTFKNEPSFSLGNLCESLGIHVNSRHRASGDAEATVYLLHKIIAENGIENIAKLGSEHGNLVEFKGAITQEMVDSLPEDPGIFRFLDKNGKILFLKSARNIFAEVSNFLIKEIKNPAYKDLFENIANIDTQVINSFIISQLQEIEEIRTVKPPYCKPNYYKPFPVGIYESKEPDRKSFYVERNANGNALWRFQTEKGAHKFLKTFIKTFQLQIPPLPASKSYIDVLKLQEKKVNDALSKKLFPYRNFFLVRDVPFANLVYLIYVEDFVYQGFAEVDRELFDGSIDAMKESIVLCDNNPHSQRILQNYIRKKRNVKLVPC
jgi:DNA polymerase III subunit epsilon